MKLKQITLTRKPPLFFDYLNHFEKVQSFYRWNPYESGDWQAVISDRGKLSFPRKPLSDILLRQNQHWGAPPETLENIKRLADENTFCVVTGQQAGIMGGPLYTIYKMITAIKRCQFLQDLFPQFYFVPLFWLEVNDNDFKEINHIQYITKDNELCRLSVEEKSEEHLQPISYRKLDGQISRWRESVATDFFDTEFKDAALDLFFQPYSVSETYGEAFARLCVSLFGRYGMVVLNPADPDVNTLAEPVYRKALEAPGEIRKTIDERNQRIREKGYPIQIQLRRDQTLLFYIDEQQRRVRIDLADEQHFSLNYPEESIPVSRKEMLHTCEKTPWQFSPNVALRPLVQDFLLPTVAYVAGPSETAYFAQVEALYSLFNISMPIIFPRHRVTIVEGKIQRLVEKLNLDYETVLNSRGNFIEPYIRGHTGNELFRAVEKSGEQIEQVLDRLETLVAREDPTLVNSVRKTRQNIEGSFRKLSGKITRSLEEKNRTLVNQLERVMLHLLPQHTYQERVLNLLYFCIKYGVDFSDKLLSALPDETEQHTIVEL